MAKHCLLCGNKIGKLERHLTIKEGCICYDCANRYYGVSEAELMSMPIKGIESIFKDARLSEMEAAAERLRLLAYLRRVFTPTLNVGDCVMLDDGNKAAMVATDPAHAKARNYKGYTVVPYEVIERCEVIEDDEARADGACRSLVLKLSLADRFAPTLTIPFITSKTKKESSEFESAEKDMRDSIWKFQAIITEKETTANVMQPLYA